MVEGVAAVMEFRILVFKNLIIREVLIWEGKGRRRESKVGRRR